MKRTPAMKEDNNFLRIAGKRLEIAWYGPSPEDTPTLVFLHEGLGCVSMWREFPARLAAATGCGALVYSRLGYGLSDPCSLPRPVRYMHDEGLETLPALIDEAGIRECILIGHSDGGSIAIIYAGGTPAIPLRGLITEAAHVFCEEINLNSIRKAGHAFKNGDLRSKLEKFHGANTDCAFWGWNGAWLHPDFVNWNLEQYLPGIRVPMLAIQGEEDEYGTFAQINAIKRQSGEKVETLLLENCNHCPHHQQQAKTFDAMRAFILRVINSK